MCSTSNKNLSVTRAIVPSQCGVDMRTNGDNSLPGGVIKIQPNDGKCGQNVQPGDGVPILLPTQRCPRWRRRQRRSNWLGFYVTPCDDDNNGKSSSRTDKEEETEGQLIMEESDSDLICAVKYEWDVALGDRKQNFEVTSLINYLLVFLMVCAPLFLWY